MRRTTVRTGVPVAALFAAFLATAAIAAEPANLAGNGGFEDGVSGWLYQQWEGKQPPGEIDAKDFKEGKASFRMGVASASGGRYFAKEIKIEDPSQDHVVLVWLKTKDVPYGAAHLQIGIEGRGWLGSATGQTDALVLGGTTDWKLYGVFLPAGALGKAKKVTLFFRHDQLGKGTLWIDDLVVRPGKESDVPTAPKPLSLSGDTSRPDTSTFVLGEKVQLTFQVGGLEEGQKLTLPVRIVDEHEKEIATTSLPVVGDAKGHWTGTMDAPCEKLGFYRVRAELSNGARIESLGSRAAGYLTYAVVPDPAGRKLYSEKETFFGMQGGFGSWKDDICRKLGIRWVLDDSLQWKRREPKKAGEFDADKEIDKLVPIRSDGSKWVTYPLPTLFGAPAWAVDPKTFAYMTGALTEEGEKAWDAYCRKAARVFCHRYPDLEQHIYQITWEPIRPWGYRGTDKQLVRIYEIAHKALHDVDPKAVVAGPCRGIKEDDVPSMRELAQAGIMPYLDAFTAHPYYPMPSEKEGMVACLRNMKRTLRELSGKDLPMYGTEQGHSTDEDPSRELNLARELMRQNLMMLGEGFRFNILFYIVDYRLGPQRGYGYYYALLPGVPWAPGKIGPKPIAPALAAQSLLLEGHKSAGAIEWLGETAWGYAYQRGDDVVLALWDYGDKPRKVMIPVGAESVVVHDWMGNAKATPAPSGVVTLELGPEPVYIAGVSNALWGDGDKALRVAEGSFVSCPGQRVMVKAVVSRLKGGPDKAELRFEADPRLGVKPQTRAITFGSTEQVCTFEVDIPGNTEPGRYTFHMLLRDGGRDLGVAGGAVETVSPVQIVDILPAEVGGQARGLALLLKDRRGNGVSGTVGVELEGVAGVKASAEFRLAAGETSRVVVDLGKLDLSPARIVDVLTAVRTADGYVATEKARANFLLATRCRTAPSVDGNLADWADVPSFELRGKEHVNRSPQHYTGDADQAVKVQYAWDDKALYMALAVTDDAHVQPAKDVNTWRFDCVQAAFAMNPKKQGKVTGNLLDDVGSQRHTEINFALTSGGVEAYRSITCDEEHLPSGPVAAGRISLAVVRTGTQTIYEIAIPWSELGALQAPRAGDVFGLAAAFNDADSPDQRDPSALGLFGGIAPAKDPGKFGLLLLGS